MMSLLEHRDRILKNIFKPAFKALGFSVSGTTFKKQENGFIKIFNIQSSGFNVEDHVSCRPFIGLTMIKNGNIERGDQILNEFLPTTSEDWKQEIIEFRKTLN